jgi:PAS domain S-box-containing protein
MNEMIESDIKEIHFLEGGGEMGRLIRTFNWSQTPLGSFNSWPQSLRTAISIILSSEFPMFLWWGEEMIQFYNDAYRPSFGENGKHPHALGQRAIECWPEIWSIIFPLIKQVRTTHKSFFLEDQLIPIYRNGKLDDVYWTFSYSAVKGEEGKVDGVLVVCNETTSKVLNTKRIEESEHRLRSVLSETPSAIAILTGPEMKVEMFNDAMLKIWKRDGNILGKQLLQHIPELIGQSFPRILKKVYETGETYIANEELAYFSVDSKLVPGYFNYSYTALRNNNQEVIGILVIASDVTESVTTRKKMEESERNLRNLVEQAPVAMCILKGSSFIVEVANERIFELWGKQSHEILHKPLFEGLPEAREQGIEALLYDVYTTGKRYVAFERPVKLPRKGKIETTYINFVYEAFYEGDSISGVMAVAIEVTDQVLARQKIEDVVSERTRELAEVNNNLQKSNKELAQFAYIASHDLQEPARKISTFVDMLQNSLGPINDRSKKYLDKISSSSARMLALIRDVLTYSQLSQEKPKVVAIDLNAVIKTIESDFELLIEQKGATIECSSLPIVEGIPLQINQLFSNLISNALKFSQNNKKPFIKFFSSVLQPEALKDHSFIIDKEQVYYKISCQDNGIGFKQENAHQIFQIFQRLHGKAEFEGTGIGLAMCKRIAENHHGDIYAISSPGEGTVFNIILPSTQF